MPNIILAVAEVVEKTAQPNFVETLGINWKLFLAQLVNFGIVIFILWRWVMKPVVGALEARRQKIEQSVKKAEDIERRMQEFELDRESLLKNARREAEALLKKTTDSAENMKQETLEAARREAERIMADTRAAIDTEKDRMLREIREEVANLTVLATEKILREKLSTQKDRELVQDVLKSIR